MKAAFNPVSIHQKTPCNDLAGGFHLTSIRLFFPNCLESFPKRFCRYYIHLNAIHAEAKAVTPVRLGYGMSVGSPVKNVETSSPAPTRHARSYAPQRFIHQSNGGR